MTLDRPACPACDCAAMSPFTESDDRTLLICRDCRHITWAAMPTLAQLTTFYTEQYTGTHQQEAIQADRRAYYRSHAIELATAHGAPIESLAIADVGCSYPVFLHEAAQAGAAVTVGVDWSSDARAFGRQHDIPVITPDEFLALIPDNALDVLRYSHTLEHLVDPRAVLAAHVRKLRPGGLLYITQPNFPVFRAESTAVALHDARWPAHLHFFNPLSLSRLTAAVGLTIESFVSVHEPEERYRPFVDDAHARTALAALAGLGEPIRGAANNFPWFLGPDAVCRLRRPTRPRVERSDDPVTDSLLQTLAAHMEAAHDATRRAAVGRHTNEATAPGRSDDDALDRLRSELACSEEQRRTSDAALAAVLSSTSWRLTRPLRALKRRLGG